MFLNLNSLIYLLIVAKIYVWTLKQIQTFEA